MRTARIFSAAALGLLGLAPGACGSKDATGPNISLSQGEVASLGQEIGNVIDYFDPYPGSFDASHSCPVDGSVRATGSLAVADSVLTLNATLTFDGCRTAHYTANGPMTVTGGAVAGRAALSFSGVFRGSLGVATQDGRTGACPVDFTVSGSELQTGPVQLTVTGTACGQGVGGMF